MCQITHSPAFLAQEIERLQAELILAKTVDPPLRLRFKAQAEEVERLRVALRRLRAGLEPDAGYYKLSLHDAREIIDQALGSANGA